MTGDELKVQLELFVERAKDDPRMSVTHASLYLSLLFLVRDGSIGSFISLHRNQIMVYSKIRARQTYNRHMQDLHEFGYIEYRPSKDPKVASQVRTKTLQ